MSDPLRGAFARITGARDADLRPGEARNGVIHVVALTLTRTADALIDPKLVLAWLLSALGAPGAMIGALAPVREAGALLPQLALARRVEAAAQRKRFWAWGTAVQGLAALGIAAAALLLTGAAAGGAILACLAVLAVARAAASVSHKDALARTVAKRRRGAVTGLAASVAAVSVFGVGLALATGPFEAAVGPLAALIATAGAALLAASVIFGFLREPRTTPRDADDDGSFAALVAPILTDAQLRRFVAARAALAVTALAPPFIVMLSAAEGAGGGLDRLGPLVMASTAASVLAGYVWGRLSDRSSRLTLTAAGAVGAAAFAATGAAGLATGGLGGWMGAAAAIFAAQIAHAGVRAGRKLHLTDMAEDSFRARYTALSNTLIGLALLAGGLFGLAADRFGPAAVLVGFAALAALGAVLARGLDEVQAR